MIVKKEKIRIWEWLLLLVCLFLTLKQISLMFPLIKDVVVLIAGCATLAICASKFLIRKEFFWLSLYFLVLLLNLYSGDQYFSNIGMVVEETAILFFTAAFSYYVFSNKKEKLSLLVVFVILAVIVYYSVYTNIINIENPGIVRQAVIMANEEDSQLKSFYLQGLVNYQLPHAIPIIIPAIILNLRNNEKSTKENFFYIIVLLASLSLVYISFSATAMLLTILSLVLALLVRKDSPKNNLVRLGLISIIALPVVINTDLILNPLLQLFSSSDNAIYFDRLLDIQNMTKGSSSGDLASRQDMYSITFSVLSGNIFLGTNALPGGHMVIFDRLACLGFVGWIPYILFIYNHIKYTVKQVEKQYIIYYYIGLFVGLLMLALKGINGWEMWLLLFTILPLMIKLSKKNFLTIKQ